MALVAEERFVARAAELAHLDDAFRRAQGGQGSLTLILAEAGGGKTRLVDEFVASQASRSRFAWGRAVEDAAVAYRPLRQAFRRLGMPFPLPEGDAAEDRAAQLLTIAEEMIAAMAWRRPHGDRPRRHPVGRRRLAAPASSGGRRDGRPPPAGAPPASRSQGRPLRPPWAP